MKQVLQNPRTGTLELVEVPAPATQPGMVVVRNRFSVVSPGTEKMALDFARKSLLGKARSRPDLVKQVTRKLRQEGPLPTYRAVTNRLDAPQPLGYSCAGVVAEVGAGVTRFAPGDRVACAGAGYANHAEVVAVPENLVVSVPESLPLEKAAFATLGAIALQGLRVAAPTLGEVAVVIGLGLIGQLAVQLLRANGCRVLGIDLDERRVKQALDQGAEWGAAPNDDHGPWRDAATRGHGADLVLVAAASDSSAPIQLGAELCRMKGRIAVIGATAMDLDRRAFYEKELELRMSMSYGPGRYDRGYEELGLDYPIAHVRWTENRNLEAFVALTASGALDPDRLDTETLPFEDAPRCYDELAQGRRSSLAVLFQYAEEPEVARTLKLAGAPGPAHAARDEVGIAFLGAGNYATGVLLPVLSRIDSVRPRLVVTSGGASGRRVAERFGFESCGTDPEAAFQDPTVDLVFIATRHDSHAALAEQALRANKGVWLEKPMALTREEAERVISAARETQGFLAVGYNRRFSRHARAVRDAFAQRRGSLAVHYVVAAGEPPQGSWITDPRIGGGRIVGEACHFVDLCTFLVGAPPVEGSGTALSRDPDVDDSVVARLRFADGSAATIEYLAHASPQLPKERFEASADGVTASCDNFRTTRVLGAREHRTRTLNQDKGQERAVTETLAAFRAGQPSPFPLEELEAVCRTTFEIAGK